MCFLDNLDRVDRVLGVHSTQLRELDDNEKLLINRISNRPDLGAPVATMVERILQGVQQGFKDLSMTQVSFVMQQARNLGVSLNR